MPLVHFLSLSPAQPTQGPRGLLSYLDIAVAQRGDELVGRVLSHLAPVIVRFGRPREQRAREQHRRGADLWVGALPTMTRFIAL